MIEFFDMHMFNIFILALLVFVFLVSLELNYNHDASAHISKTFGNTTVEVGWLVEPTYIGQLNGITLQASKISGQNQIPILNALSNATISVKYGTLTKQLDFEPSATADGLYEAKILPTRTGPYSVLLAGDIKGQKIAGELKIEDVEGTQTVAFPDASSQTQTNSNAEGKIEAAVSQLSNDIDDTKNSLTQIKNMTSSFGESLQTVNQNASKSYMISLAAAGVGLGGIAIGATALSKVLKRRIS
ncbi:MAG: hypothetical protein WB511_06550 [Nitrososphaeraceae archaeon]